MNGGLLIWVLIGLFWGAGIIEKVREARRAKRDRYWTVNAS